MTTPADVVNRAVQLIGGYNNQAPITGSPPTFDGTDVGLAAGVLYNGVVQTVARQFGWDFSRTTVTLVASAATPVTPWSNCYQYPTDCVEVRQIMPASTAPGYDANNPHPHRWSVQNALISGVPTKVIMANLALPAVLVYTNQPPEGSWDALFTEAVVRLLASELSMAVPGRPSTSQAQLDQAAGFERAGEGRGES